ncbi:phage tail protein [Aquimarina aquimarini]|uniref:phage tail protein n=1 Tax=Aquimarina aquimarini TaxID=1191734 RepID=UPI000D5551A0|nr:tail fiber protein [Aquimarina aquimarini]
MDPFLGQIVLFGGNFAPRGWALCEGQLLPISQNSALFSILGTIYGGDGRTTFALPDLRGRAPIGAGGGPGLSDRRLGSRSGQETHTLNITEMPSHNHLTQNNPSADQHVQLSADSGVRDKPQAGDVPAGASFGSGLGATPVNAYGPANNPVNGQEISGNAGLTILNNGGNQPHNNMQPYLTTNYIIALQGVFPSRN